MPEALEAIITRCLAPDPVGRYQTTGALEAALTALDADGHPLAMARRRRGRTRDRSP